MKRFLPVLIIVLATLITVPIILYAAGETIRKCTIVEQAEGEPLVGVAIIFEGSTSGGAITDVDGRVCLEGDPDAYVVITFIGYISQRYKLKDLPERVCLYEAEDED